MKIALVGFHFAEMVARLALALSPDHEVEAFLCESASGRELTPDLRRQLESAIKVHYLPRARRVHMLRHGLRLARLVDEAAPDVVHAQEAAGWTMLAFRHFAGGRRRAFVLTVHDPHPHSGDAHIRARTQWADARVRRGADALIVHGEKLAPALEEMDRDVRGRIHVVAHGALGESRAGSRPPGRGRFLFFGRVQAYKGLGVLLDAVEMLMAQGRAFEVVIAGDGDDLDRWRPRIARLPAVRLDARFIPADEVGALFAGCDAVVTPYLDATQSGVCALAMNAGRGVIVTDVGAIGEIVRDGENGLVTPRGDAAALAAAMARILDDPNLAERLGAAAAATAASGMSWPSIAAETASVYEAALKGRVRSATFRSSLPLVRRLRPGP